MNDSNSDSTSHVMDEQGAECVRCTARDLRDLARACPGSYDPARTRDGLELNIRPMTEGQLAALAAGLHNGAGLAAAQGYRNDALAAAAQAQRAARGAGEIFQHQFEHEHAPRKAYRFNNTAPYACMGGIVATTASVHPKAFISSNSEVSGSAIVREGAVVSESARVFCSVIGNQATVCGAYLGPRVEIIPHFTVSGGHWEESPPQGICGRFTMGVPAPGYFAVGCQTFPIEEWVDSFTRIADDHNATRLERELAWSLLMTVRRMTREGQLPR